MLRIFVLLFVAISTSAYTCVITGANSGIGLAATKDLVNKGWNVVALCRSKERAQRTLGFLSNVEIVEVDLASLDSVRSFCEIWLASKRKTDVLVCNAGIQLNSGGGSTNRDPFRTTNGFECTVGTNHIGHFVLVNNILPTVVNRLVWVGSGVHNPDEPGGDVGSKATLGDMSGLVNGFMEPVSMIDNGVFNADKAYKDSKLCNVITSLECARRLQVKKENITCNVMNPGLIPTTGLFRELNPIFVAIFTFLTRYIFRVAVSEEEGGRRLSYLIDSDAVSGVTGAYFSGKPGEMEFKPYPVSVEAAKEETGKRLWSLTADLTKPYLINQL
jgi:protochlorophyllide reductase